MIFRQRATQAEYFDDPRRTAAEVMEGYRLLNRVNRVLAHAHPFQLGISRHLGVECCRELSLLDLGAGDGALGRQLTEWAARRGWKWQVTNLDLNPLAFPNGPDARNVVGSVLSLPFADDSFDVVIASLMTHHLASDDEVRRHFREAWRVSRELTIIVDAHRNRVAYAAMWVLLHALRCPREFREDGLLSIRRGWRTGEWRRLAAEAAMVDARVRFYFGSKVVLTARKQAAAAAGLGPQPSVAPERL